MALVLDCVFVFWRVVDSPHAVSWHSGLIAMMTPTQLAEKLNGREYRSEMSDDEEQIAKDQGLIVIFGASDDLIEFRGAINDEEGLYDGGTVLILKDRILPKHEDCECKFCGYKAAAKNASKIDCKWSHKGYSWFITTKLPHATFDVMEDGEKYCHGIVVSIADVAN